MERQNVLIFGIGVHGGGAAAAEYFFKKGHRVRATDLRDEATLKPSLDKLRASCCLPELILGANREEDVRWADLIVVNPGASLEIPLLKLARELGKKIINEASFFMGMAPNPVIGVTGTRGKTTTTTWLHRILKTKFPATIQTGNAVGGSDTSVPLFALLDSLPSAETPLVAELSSFQLELFADAERPPYVAVITNLHRDHLNRYGEMEPYARAKANIFVNQTADDHLVLNADDEWTPFFLSLAPKARVWQISQNGAVANGMYEKNGALVFTDNGNETALWNVEEWKAAWGAHSLYNLMNALLAAYLSGMKWQELQAAAATLNGVKYRQETVADKNGVTIVNDTAATSPDGGIAALRRFANKKIILIAGGTDKNLAFDEWAAETKRYVAPENLFLLAGSATDKMIVSLAAAGYEKITPFVDFNELVRAAFARAKEIAPSTLLFSPSAASFEKFLNEFDRGDKFNELVKTL